MSLHNQKLQHDGGPARRWQSLCNSPEMGAIMCGRAERVDWAALLHGLGASATIELMRRKIAHDMAATGRWRYRRGWGRWAGGWQVHRECIWQPAHGHFWIAVDECADALLNTVPEPERSRLVGIGNTASSNAIERRLRLMLAWPRKIGAVPGHG